MKKRLNYLLLVLCLLVASACKNGGFYHSLRQR